MATSDGGVFSVVEYRSMTFNPKIDPSVFEFK